MDRVETIDEIEEAVSGVCSRNSGIIAGYLYGSFARGDHDEVSDIDIALLFEDYDIHKLLELARKIDNKIDSDRKIDVRALNRSDLVFQKNVLSDSIILYEGDKERRMDFERKIFRRYLDMKPHIQHYYDMRSERVGA
jgi:predicted nucleotidyltransferase